MNPRIETVLAALRAHPLADSIVVFGSLAKGSATPGDVDAVIDLRPRTFDSHDPAEVGGLIRLARANYGWFDPFIRYEDELLVRNAEATGWQRASYPKEILANVDAEGVSLKKLSGTDSESTPPLKPTARRRAAP